MKLIRFETTMLKFRDRNDLLSNWTYIPVSSEQAISMNHTKKTGFRATGMIDKVTITKVALQPDGEGDFYMPLNATIRKALKKEAGARVTVQIALDDEPPPINAALVDCLKDEPIAWQNFSAMKRSHQLYFSNWVDAAKTASTKTTRIAHCVNALIKNYDYGQMIRSLKKDQ